MTMHQTKTNMQSYVEEVRSTIDSLLECTKEDVDAYTSTVRDIDEYIEGQLEDYNRARDIDFRYQYEDDLDGQKGRRLYNYNEIFQRIEEARNALCDMTSIIDDALDVLNGLEEDDDIPDDISWDIPRADEY